MSVARNKRRHEAKHKARSEQGAVYIPLVVTFRHIGEAFKQSVVLYCSNDAEPEPTDENTIAVLPVRGELTKSRKEDIVLKFVTLASACILEPGEEGEGAGEWKLVRGDGKVRASATNLWPSFMDGKEK